jgi:DNA topoisomerase-1
VSRASESPQLTDAAAKRSASSARLRYVTDAEPGIRRRKRGRGFQYIWPGGRTVAGGDQLDRIRSLAVPPAWTEVWICRTADGHLQATGRDARGRTQYRYHPRWSKIRDQTKYHRMLAFGGALPAIRRQVDRDMARHALSRAKVVGTVVRLLDTTTMRVGNDEYARENGSFGLTTLRDRHVSAKGSHVRFRFRGKGGKMHDIELEDARMARVVRRCEELPGQNLFQYLDGDGEPSDVNSEDVNEYLQECSGEGFTAKDFRTWTGTVLAAWALEELGAFGSETEANRQVVTAVESVSEALGNTPAVCRRCYVHPDVFEAHRDGTLDAELTRRGAKRVRGLTAHEAAVLRLLSRSR